MNKNSFSNQDTKGVIAEVIFLCTYDQQTEFSLILSKKKPKKHLSYHQAQKLMFYSRECDKPSQKNFKLERKSL